MDTNKITIPNATFTGRFERQYDLDKYNDTAFFHLKDTAHEFTMSLRDVLKCIKQAEENGLVPKLPQNWWDSVSSHYNEFTTYDELAEDNN